MDALGAAAAAPARARASTRSPARRQTRRATRATRRRPRLSLVQQRRAGEAIDASLDDIIEIVGSAAERRKTTRTPMALGCVVTKLHGAFEVQFLCAQHGAGVILNMLSKFFC